MPHGVGPNDFGTEVATGHELDELAAAVTELVGGVGGVNGVKGG